MSHWKRNLSLFPAMCPEGAGVPGVETGQYPPQSGSIMAIKVVTQPRGTDNDSTRIWNEAFSSSVTPITFHMLGSVMWPGAMVWTEQCLESPIITENSSGHSTPDHWGLQREHLTQGGFACVVFIHPYLYVVPFFLLFTEAKDLRISCLLSYQLVAQCGLAQPSRWLNKITPWGPWCEVRWQMGVKIKLLRDLCSLSCLCDVSPGL